MSARIIRDTIFEDSGWTALARVYGNAGALITQASLTSITCKVFDLDGTTPDTATSTPTVTIASTVFDTLQTDAIWTKDTTGYNFKHALPASSFATGGHRYVVEYVADPVSGEDFVLGVFEVYAVPIRSS